MARHVHHVTTWTEAREVISRLNPALPVTFGTGNPIQSPYIQAVPLDADAGEGAGYRVTIRPTGDGYQNDADYHLIYVHLNPRHNLMCREHEATYRFQTAA